ncbi:tyrosine-type recombinase/integrase [Aquibacillus saliphilus]|uniref:tyrosine-type recombinase/integrase n=1 Tax=Aquibacillus saliphilus TaxID=1909422 RepID=UPI001CEFF497|nr:tyrosine-type recombinase/integrase [Aquibacillus saliphilus]
MDNVVRLNQQEFFYDHLEDYISGLDTESTRINYRQRIKKFLSWKFPNESIHHISTNDINMISYVDVKKFRDHARKKHASSSVNGIMYALYGMFRYLKRIKDDKGNHVYSIDVEELKVRKLKESDKEEYGFIEWDELSDWISYLRTDKSVANGEKKAVLIHTARLTGMRKQDLANLKFKHLQKIDGVWTLQSRIKGKQKKYSLTEEDAELILNLKKTDDSDEQIFFATKTMDRLIAHLREQFNISPDRNIVFHSIRGESAYMVYLSSGRDILKVQNHLNHSSINTSFNYISKRNSIQQDPTLYMNQNLGVDTVDELSTEQWKDVYNELSRSAKFEIKDIMDKLGYSNK